MLFILMKVEESRMSNLTEYLLVYLKAIVWVLLHIFGLFFRLLHNIFVSYTEFDTSEAGDFDDNDIHTRKTKVDKYIESSIRECKDYQLVLQGVESINHTLDFRETQYVKEEYVKSCLQVFLDELHVHLQLALKQIYSDRSCFTKYAEKFLKGTNSIDVIGINFREIKQTSLIVNCARDKLLSKADVDQFLKKVRQICLQKFSSAGSYLAAEKQFIDALDNFIKLCFLSNSLFSGSIFENAVDISEDENVIIQSLFGFLAQTKDVKYEELKVKAKELGEVGNCSEVLVTSVAKLLKESLTAPIPCNTTHRGHKIIEFKGRYVSLLDIVRIVSNIEANSYDEVQIYAQKLAVANSSLEWPGKNLVLIAPELIVQGSVVWDVSGKDGNHEFNGEKADSGRTEGQDGKPGKHGSNGESGGNVLVISDKIENLKQMMIITNGGDGRSGQDGGDGRSGADGRDGTNMSESDFKSKFPKSTSFFDIRVSGLKSHNDNIHVHDIQERKETSLTKEEIIVHMKGETTQGSYEVELCFFHRVNLGTGIITWFGYPSTQAFCFIKGSNGTPGQKGGDGGAGGAAGLGGYAGSVCLMDMKSMRIANIRVEDFPGKDGTAGKDGRGGKGGKNGKKGYDHARVDPNGSYRDSRYYYGHLYMDTEVESSPNNAWCEHKSRYIAIKHTSVSSTKQEDGKIGHVHEKHEKQATRMRKKAIRTESVFAAFNTKFASNFYADSSINEQLSATVKASKVTSVTAAQETVLENQRQSISVLISPPTSENASNKVRRSHTELVKVPNRHGEDTVDPQDRGKYTPILLQSANLYLANIINSCNRATRLEEWIHYINSLLTEIQQKNVKKEEIRVEVAALMAGFQRKLRYYDVNGHTVSELTAVLSKWKSLKLKTPENTLKEIEHTWIEKYKYALLNNLSEFVWNAVMRETDDSKQAILDGALHQVLVRAVTELQQINTLPEMGEYVDQQKIHIEKTIEKILTNETLTMIPSFSDEDIKSNLTTPEIKQEIEQKKRRKCTKWEQSERKSWVSDLPPKLQNCIKKISYLPDDEADELLTVLCSRLKIETLRIGQNILQWLVTRILTENNVQGPEDFIVLFATSPQNTWMAEYVLLQLRDKLKIPQKQLQSLRQKLTGDFYGHPILLLLSQQLVFLDQETTLQAADIIEILELSQCIEVDDAIIHQLENISICDWSYRLRWFTYLMDIEHLKTDRKWKEEEVFEAAYHLSQLNNKYGDSSVKSFMEILKPRVVNGSILIHVARKFNSNHYIFDAEALSTINHLPMSEWVSMLDQKFVQNEERTIKTLLQLMNYDSNNSHAVLQNLDNLLEFVNTINKFQNCSSRIMQTDKAIGLYDLDLIKKWAQYIRQKGDETARTYCISDNIEEVVAVINRGIQLTKGFALRDTQKLSLAIFLSSGSGMLQQVATGEGKSLIITTAAIVKALSGENVDVITSSSVLAVRDAGLYVDLYTMFGVKVGHNSSELPSDRKASYIEKDVVYGTIGEFQRDVLLDEFYNEDVGIGSRKPGYVIVDEVDSLLLDKGQNLLYLSHSIPNMDLLEPVYVYIWNYIHSKNGMHGSDEDIKYVQEQMIDAMYGILTERELCARFPQKAHYIADQLQQWRIIGTDGRILIRNDIEEYSHSGKVKGSLRDVFKLEVSNKEQQILLSYLKDKIRQGVMVPVPGYLREFVDLHLFDWIKSAFAARHMVQNDQYIIDSDRSEAACNAAPNIIIMDKDTGEEQYHSQWGSGLHQFLQLKHGARLSFEGLKAVFISNVTYFSRYGQKLFGLTGTLGSTRERDLLKSIYEIEYATVPSFRPSRFTEELTKVCSAEEDWLEEITNSSKLIARHRPVLVICESVRDVEKLEKQIGGHVPLYVYKRSYEPLSIGTKTPIDKGCVILATNLAGRGTDIQVSERISKQGGMHVCLTYLPPNIRVEEQAFGRAGRKGQRGTGQIVCLDGDNCAGQKADNILQVVKMKIERNIKEEEHLDQIQKNYEQVIKVEEHFFRQFRQAYKAVQNAGREPVFQTRQTTRLVNQAITVANYAAQKLFDCPEKRNIILQNCLDEWAFCLDKASQQENNELKQDIVNRFVSGLQEAATNSCLDLISGASHRIKLAKVYIKNKEYEKANDILDQLIKDDERFSEVAHYYKCHCIAIESGINTQAKKESFIYHLQYADRLIKHRCQSLSTYAQVISSISQSYTTKRQSFLFADDYAKQKEDMVNTLFVYITSIQDMLGYEVSADMLQTNDTDQLQTKYIHNLLFEKGLLEPAKVTNNIRKNVWNEIHDRYACYFSALKTHLEQLRNRSVTPETFQSIVPSREVFWQMLLDDGFLTDEQHFVLLDKEKLGSQVTSSSETVKSILKDLMGMQGSNNLKKHLLDIHEANTTSVNRDHSENDQLKTESVRRVMDSDEAHTISENMDEPENVKPKPEENITCVSSESEKNVSLYPEQLADVKSENVHVLSYVEFENMFGKIHQWNALQGAKILQTNQTAKLKCNGKGKMRMYDGIHPDAFTEITGVDSAMSKTIYECLKDCTHESIDEVEEKLIDFWQYQSEIENIISKYFQFRKAFQDLLLYGYISLDSQPHNALYEDLVSLHVIKPVMVSSTINMKKLERSAVEMFGQKQLLDKITGGIDELHEKKKQKTNEDLWFIDNVKEKSKKAADSAAYHAKSAIRQQGKVSKHQLTKICSIPSEQVNSIWSTLKSESCIDEFGANEAHIICREARLANMKDIPAPVRLFLTSIINQREGTAGLVSNLKLWKCSLEKYDCPITNLTGLQETVKPKMPSEEIAQCQTNGLGDVMGLSEKKWTWSSIMWIGAVVLMGLAQMALGVLIEIYTVGFGTYVGSALLTEGCGDLIFAVECAFRGHCNWESYWEHKLLSIKITAATAGIGMLLSRGAKFSKFGFRLGRSHLQHMCGRELIKQVGTRHIIIAAAQRIAQKAIESAAVGLANGVVDNFVNKKLQDFYQKVSESIISKNKSNVENSNLKAKMKELAEKVGAVKAKQVLSQLMSECVNGGVIHGVLETIGQFGRSLSTGFGLAVKKMGKCGRSAGAVVSKLASWLPTILDVSKYLATISKILTAAMNVTNSLISKIEDKLRTTDKAQSVQETQEDKTELCDVMMNNWTEQITSHVQTVISEEIAKPVLRQGAQQILFYVGRQIKSQYSKYQNQQRRREFDSLKADHKKAKEEADITGDDRVKDQVNRDYQKALLNLLQETKDPLLFAEIVREGVPMGIHCVQALAEITKRPICIHTTSEDGTVTMPNLFTPSSCPDNVEPISLEYIGEEGDFCGHFISSQSNNQDMASNTFDCLLDAVSSQLENPVSRENIASEIERDPECQAGIEQGIHKYLNHSGGARRPVSKTNAHKAMMKDVRGRVGTGNDIRRKLIDKAVTEDGAKHGTGNDELFQRSKLPQWAERSANQPKGTDLDNKEFDHLDCLTHIRVDNKFVIWRDGEKLGGHDGALYDHNDGKIVGGRNIFHGLRTEAIMRTESAGEAARVALAIHMSLIIEPNELKKMTRDELRNTYTAYGHNLAIGRQKAQFCIGYEREYYKIWLVGKKFNADLPEYKPPSWLKNDGKMQTIIHEINSAKSLEDFGNVLMKPAPFGYTGKTSPKK